MAGKGSKPQSSHQRHKQYPDLHKTALRQLQQAPLSQRGLEAHQERPEETCDEALKDT